MKNNKLLLALVVAIFMISSLGAVLAVNGSSPAIIARTHRISDATATSTNWSGYAVTGPSNSVSFVGGTWTVPAVQCTSTNTWSSFWVGIDGFSSNSVEQLGTDSDCSGGSPTYYAWREMYPHPSYLINTITVHPGDQIYASVTSSGKSFTLYMKDQTTGVSFSYTARAKASRSSAEWIVEAPYSGGILPLANFGTAYFTSDSATISGTTAYINGFSSSSTYQINMVTSSGALKDTTSSLSGNGDFSVSWVSMGP